MTRRATRSGRGTVQVEFVAASAYFSGLPHHQLAPVAQAVGTVCQWSHTRQALGVPARAAADVEAHLDAAGYVVEMSLPGMAAVAEQRQEPPAWRSSTEGLLF